MRLRANAVAFTPTESDARAGNPGSARAPQCYCMVKALSDDGSASSRPKADIFIALPIPLDDALELAGPVESRAGVIAPEAAGHVCYCALQETSTGGVT
jgi:hypothetical protein